MGFVEYCADGTTRVEPGPCFNQVPVTILGPRLTCDENGFLQLIRYILVRHSTELGNGYCHVVERWIGQAYHTQELCPPDGKLPDMSSADLQATWDFLASGTNTPFVEEDPATREEIGTSAELCKNRCTESYRTECVCDGDSCRWVVVRTLTFIIATPLSNGLCNELTHVVEERVKTAEECRPGDPPDLIDARQAWLDWARSPQRPRLLQPAPEGIPLGDEVRIPRVVKRAVREIHRQESRSGMRFVKKWPRQVILRSVNGVRLRAADRKSYETVKEFGPGEMDFEIAIAGSEFTAHFKL